MTNFKKINLVLVILGLILTIKVNKEFSNINTKLIPKGFFFITNPSVSNFLNPVFLLITKTVSNVAFTPAMSVNTNRDASAIVASNIYNKKLFDLSLPLSKGLVGYNFSKVTNKNNKETNTNKLSKWYLTEDLNKIISAFFKSIYCLISKPKYINNNDKIIIEILYYITIPDNNVFKWYNFIYINKNINHNIKLKKKIRWIRRKKTIRTILNKNFLIKQTLFKLNNSNIANIYFNKFTIFFKFLSSYFRKPIEFNLIRIHKSDYDSNILAQLFILILKRKNIRIAINKIYDKNNIGQPSSALAPHDNYIKNIPATISGLYIHIGGRLMREPIIPRMTTKKFEKGAIATALAPGLEGVNFLDSARITKKNKKGAYTIKIAYAQNLVK